MQSNNDSNSQNGWGSWIRKERNSDCSPQAQSRQQRMTESEANCHFKKVPFLPDFSPKIAVFCTFSETISPFFPNLVSPSMNRHESGLYGKLRVVLHSIRFFQLPALLDPHSLDQASLFDFDNIFPNNVAFHAAFL